MMNTNKSLKKNFLYNVLLRILNIIFPLFTFPYVARVLSPEGIGKVDFSFSVVQYFVLIAQVGIPTYAIRECAKYRDQKDKLAKTTQEILIINSFMVVLSYILFILIILNFNSLTSYRLLLLLAGINILSTSIGMEWFYQAIEEYKRIIVRSTLTKVLSLILIFTLVRNENDYIIYGFIMVFSNSVAYAYNFIYANKHIKLFKKYEDYDIKRHFRPIMMLFAMSVSVSIYINLNKVMLGLISGDKAVGLYTSANKMIMVVLALVTSLGTVLLPRMSYYIEKNENIEINKLINKSFDFTLMLSIPAAIAVFMLAKPIILLFSGTQYLEAIPTVKIISPTILAIAINNLIGIQILVSHGKEKITLISTIAGAVVNFLINMLLIPLLQQDGAAIGSLAAEWVVTFIQFFFAYAYLKNNIAKRNILSYICGGVLMILTKIVITILIKNLFLSTGITVILCAAIYFTCLHFMKNSLLHEIKELLLNKLGGKTLNKIKKQGAI